MTVMSHGPHWWVSGKVSDGVAFKLRETVVGTSWAYSFPVATVPKDHTLGGLHNRPFVSHSSQDEGSEWRCWQVCGLSVCILPKFMCWSPNSQCDGIRRRGLWEVIWSDGRGPWSRTSTIVKGATESPLTLFCHVRPWGSQRSAVCGLAGTHRADLGFPELWETGFYSSQDTQSVGSSWQPPQTTETTGQASFESWMGTLSQAFSPRFREPHACLGLQMTICTPCVHRFPPGAVCLLF